MSMPPSPSWVWGRDAIRAFLSATAFGVMRSHWRLYRTAANGQPAFAVYRADSSQGLRRAFGIQLVTIQGSAANSLIADVTTFTIPALFTAFDFPHELSGATE
jgi:RNA polymerase sigma-70 factor (ECF subfamily)